MFVELLLGAVFMPFLLVLLVAPLGFVLVCFVSRDMLQWLKFNLPKKKNLIMRLRTLTGLINLEMLAYGYMELLLQLTTYNNNSTVHLDVLQWWLYQNFSTLIDLLYSIAEFQLMRSNHDMAMSVTGLWT